MQKLFFNKEQKGFTMLETMMAIFMLVVAGGSAIMLITKSIQGLRETSNRTIAAHLAQEGIEVARAVRNTNWIQGFAFNEDLSNGTYCIAYDSSIPFSCADFKLFANNGVYNHDSAGVSTEFERRLIISNEVDIDGTDFIRVQSEVSWRNKNLTAEDHLYDWR